MPRLAVPFFPASLRRIGRRLAAATTVNLSLAMLDASVDLAIVAQVNQYLPEPVAALADLRRVLRGRFRLTNLIAIGHNANAGVAGKELNP